MERERRITPLSAATRADFVLHVSGPGRTPMIVVDGRDASLQGTLSSVNEMLGYDAYDRVERVAVGLLDLKRSSGFHSTKGGGASHGIGSAAEERGPGAVEVAPDEVAELDTAAWLVTDETGERRLAILPSHMDSFRVVSYLEPTFRGRFAVELIDRGTFFAKPHLVSPGWRLMSDRSQTLDLSPDSGEPSGPDMSAFAHREGSPAYAP